MGFAGGAVGETQREAVAPEGRALRREQWKAPRETWVDGRASVLTSDEPGVFADPRGGPGGGGTWVGQLAGRQRLGREANEHAPVSGVHTRVATGWRGPSSWAAFSAFSLHLLRVSTQGQGSEAALRGVSGGNLNPVLTVSTLMTSVPPKGPTS